jgi:hypothetical protein
MGLWGLSRFFEEHLWLSDSSHLGSFLVQAAGLALCAAGIITMAVLWKRWKRNPPETPTTEVGPETSETSETSEIDESLVEPLS